MLVIEVVINKNNPAEKTIFLSNFVYFSFTKGLNLIIKNKEIYNLVIKSKMPLYFGAKL
jgi:hypothetical protein